MIIVGAGQAGLLAARSLALHNPTIIEQQSKLPNNHSALLRFRSNIVGDSVGIPFKKVHVYKGVLCDNGTTITNSPTLRDFNCYSFKTTGKAIERSILNTNDAVRYIAPPNFIQMLAGGANISFKNDAASYIPVYYKHNPIISTIPMPKLMDILEYKDKPYFEYLPIWTINCELLDTNIYQTLYVPYNHREPYRVSITGNLMTLEFTMEITETRIIQKYLTLLGMNSVITNVTCRKQDYGKIVPIDEFKRQKFILWATQNFNIYSLGRFATWRNILLDDVMKDIKVINNFITHTNDYQRNKHYSKGE